MPEPRLDDATKTCTRCGEAKHPLCFRSSPENRDGLRGDCRDCELESAQLRNADQRFERLNRSARGHGFRSLGPFHAALNRWLVESTTGRLPYFKPRW